MTRNIFWAIQKNGELWGQEVMSDQNGEMRMSVFLTKRNALQSGIKGKPVRVRFVEVRRKR